MRGLGIREGEVVGAPAGEAADGQIEHIQDVWDTGPVPMMDQWACVEGGTADEKVEFIWGKAPHEPHEPQQPQG